MRWIVPPALALLLFGSATLRADPPPPFVGHWAGAYHGEPIDLRLDPDGNGRYQDRPVKWRFRYGQLQLDRDGEVEVYAMKADRETLVLAGGPMATLLTFQRVTDEPELVPGAAMP